MSKSGGGLFESFFVGDEGVQYFIKPLEIKGVDKGELSMDFTFRYKNDVNTPATINVSLLTDSNFRALDSLLISNGTSTLRLLNVKHLFSEKDKAQYLSRFSGSAPLSHLKNIFSIADWKISLYSGSVYKEFKGSQRFAKKINVINGEIFDLIVTP